MLSVLRIWIILRLRGLGVGCDILEHQELEAALVADFEFVGFLRTNIWLAF